MRDFNLQLHDPPSQLQKGEAVNPRDLLHSAPIAAVFHGAGAPTEICRRYGYLMLLGQNLEFELRDCISNMQFALKFRGKEPRFAGNPKKAKFDKLVTMLASQLNAEHGPTRDFVSELDRARKFRNYLAHGFLDLSNVPNYFSHGGQQSVIHRLKLAEKIFFPLIIIVNFIGRGYAADFGVTSEYLEKQKKIRKAEQDQIERDIKEIFGDKRDTAQNT